MLKNIMQRLQQLGERLPLNPEQFNDPLATQISWHPLKSGGTNFKTHKLVETSTNRVEFKVSIGAIIFYMIFSVIGIGALGYSLYMEYQQSFVFESEYLILFGMGLVFGSIGAGMFFFGTKPIVFDKTLGYYWKGRQAPNYNLEYTSPDKFIKLSNIHALQIISEYIHSSKSSYHSYELNLVLADGNRLNVIDHGNLRGLRNDAQKLSAFLGKPVWDITMI